MIKRIALFGQGHIRRILTAGIYSMTPQSEVTTVVPKVADYTIYTQRKVGFDIANDFSKLINNGGKSLVDIYRDVQRKYYPQKDILIKSKNKKVF